MNRRQKMKRMKQELERLKKRDSVERPVLYPREQYEIKTLRASYVIAEDNLDHLDDEDIIDHLIYKIRNDIRECAEVRKTQKDPFVYYEVVLKLAVPRD